MDHLAKSPLKNDSSPPPYSKFDEDDDDDDYGSDFTLEELNIVNQLLAEAENQDDNPNISYVESHDYQTSTGVRVPRSSQTLESGPKPLSVHFEVQSSLPVDPGYPDLSKALPSSLQRDERIDDGVEVEIDGQAERNDTRTPMERFRKRRKGLSVTDLISPAWCELQYYYTLSKYGRKKSTPAMRAGTAVHSQLEQQIYTTVNVEIQTNEDAWGLRIWNVIQGLKTLQESGQTRELEVWGLVGDQVVNGVIDEVSFVCPDEGLEQKLQGKGHKNDDSSKIPAGQMAIGDYFRDQMRRPSSFASKEISRSAKAYICDVKTRGVASLPAGAAFRPTKMQLMLYHDLLSQLATDKLDFSKLASLHKLDASASFSDAFIAQIGGLNNELFYGASPSSSRDTPTSSQDSMSVLLEHNSLNQLWTLMMTEFRETFPLGRRSIGDILKAEYRSKTDGEVLGARIFAMDTDVLQMYLSHEMEWWLGKRDAEGVLIDEAFKCRTCEFAESCGWRIEQEKVFITSKKSKVSTQKYAS